MVNLRISKTDPDTFSSFEEAMRSKEYQSSEPVFIEVDAGVYEEKVEIRRGNVHIKGAGTGATVISFGNYANMIMDDGSKRGTFRSYTFMLDGDGNSLEDLTIRNTAFPRKKVAQALALYAEGEHITVKNCSLESYQDTLFTGPLPVSPVKPGGFTGPKENDERKPSHQLYENCLICGDVDFIFGSAIAFFKNCEIRSLNGLTPADQAPSSNILGYTTAASTPEGYKYGYVFDGCRFTCDGCPPESVYLGRPWRDHSKTVIMNSYLGEHIHRAGFHDWGKPQAHDTVFYAEYENYGPGADTSEREDYVRTLTAEQASEYTVDKVMSYDPQT